MHCGIVQYVLLIIRHVFIVIVRYVLRIVGHVFWIFRHVYGTKSGHNRVTGKGPKLSRCFLYTSESISTILLYRGQQSEPSLREG